MTAAAQSLDQNKATVEEFLKVFSTGSVPAILERLHPEATWWISGKGEGFAGSKSKAEMGAVLESVTTLYKDGALRLTPVSMIAEGDRVFVEAEAYGELNNGRVYNPQTAFVFEMADGLITHVKEYLDTQHAQDVFFAP
jgi:ketosteroid isomerase-like protein